MSSRPPQNRDGKNEHVTTSTITTTSRTRGKVLTPGESTMVITKGTIQQNDENEKGPRKKHQEIKVKVHSRRGRKNEDKENSDEKK